MKILFFIRANNTKYGGAENYLSRLSEALKDKNIEYQVINSVFPKFLPSWLRIILFNLQVCLTKRDNFYFSLDRISCPDIYRAGDGVHKIFLQTEKKSKTNLLHPVYLFLERKCFNNAKHIVANSHMVKNEIIDTYKIDFKKISVIYNGVKIKKFDYQQSFDKLSNEFSINKNHKILLYVGSGFQRKGVEEFLRIVSGLSDKNVRAFIIGKEKKICYYRQLSKKLNLSKKVIFTGPRSDVDDFYVVSDIFILPTHYDPFSNSVIEAMSFYNAVFTTRQNGASEILDAKFVMNSSTDYSIINQIRFLLENPEALNEVKNKNRLESEKLTISNNLLNTLEVARRFIG